MSVSTIFSKATVPILYEVLAFLRFEVVVGDVHHFELYFDWQGLHTIELQTAVAWKLELS